MMLAQFPSIGGEMCPNEPRMNPDENEQASCQSAEVEWGVRTPPATTAEPGGGCRVAGMMQLSSAVLEHAHTQPDGVTFAVRVGGRKVRCLVTRAALVFLAGHFVLAEDYAAIFNAYGAPIVNAALHKFKAAKGAKGQLIITAHDIVAYGEPALSDETPGPAL